MQQLGRKTRYKIHLGVLFLQLTKHDFMLFDIGSCVVMTHDGCSQKTSTAHAKVAEIEVEVKNEKNEKK